MGKPHVAEINVSLIKKYLAEKKIKIDGPLTIYSTDPKNNIRNFAELERAFKIYTYNIGVVSKDFPQSYWKDLFLDTLEAERSTCAAGIARSLAYSPEAVKDSQKAIEDFLTTLTGRYDEIDGAILKQFMWLVKRKLNNLSTTFHVMPILYGPQGVGKSTAISILTAPLAAYTIKGKSLDFVTDERQFKTLSMHYIVVFDEMARANKTDINHLKNIVTSDSLTGRMLFSNDSSALKQSCTFIGSTNKPVKDILKDDTGMRRFYQLDVLKDADWDALNKIDIFKIWQGINERREDAYTSEAAVLSELKKRQEELRTMDSVEEFLLNSIYYPAKTDDSEVKLQEIFDEYMAYCERSNIQFTVTKQTFSSVLVEKGWRRVDKAKTQPAFYVGKSQSPMRFIEQHLVKKGLSS